MAKKQLDKRILEHLIKKLPKHNPQSIRNAISSIKSKYGVTQNAAAKEYARRNKIKVDRWISEKDLQSWQTIPKETIQSKIIVKKTINQKSKKITEHICYDTKDRFVLQHIKEVNICCTYGAFTAAFVLCRKIIENLLIYDIILKKYPNQRDNIPIYFDSSKNRTKDFSEILKNLNYKKTEFGPEKNLLDSLLNKASIFKEEANKKTHSTYQLIRHLPELKVDDIQDILDMIAKLKNKI